MKGKATALACFALAAPATAQADSVQGSGPDCFGEPFTVNIQDNPVRGGVRCYGSYIHGGAICLNVQKKVAIATLVTLYGKRVNVRFTDHGNRDTIEFQGGGPLFPGTCTSPESYWGLYEAKVQLRVR